MGVNDFIKIGSRIKAYRINSGLTQREMAKKLGLSFSTYSNYENNYREPPSDVIDKICEILEINIPDLFGIGEPIITHTDLSDIEEKLYHLGYSIGGDESEGYLWINYPDGTLSVSQEDLLSLDESANSYLLFKLEELKKKNFKDFSPTTD